VEKGEGLGEGLMVGKREGLRVVGKGGRAKGEKGRRLRVGKGGRGKHG
jgi:hypothetical protein